MDIKINEKTDNKITFIVEGVNPAFVNAIRRLSAKSIPVLAIEEVDFYENSSPLFDEIVAQRLGQIPLDFTEGDFLTKEECECDTEEDRCPNCEVAFVLEKDEPGVVYSGDIEFPNSDVEVLYDEIPITYLGEKQEIKLEGHAVMNTGGENSKHQAAVSSYQYYPDVSVDNKSIDSAEKIVDICPRDVFTVESGKLVVKDVESCSLCNECVEESDAIEVEGRDDAFIFKLETVCGLDPEQILYKTLAVLQEDVGAVIDKLK